MRPIDTANKYGVSSRGNTIGLLFPPRGEMSKDEALTLAAWLVALACDEERFKEILTAVENT